MLGSSKVLYHVGTSISRSELRFRPVCHRERANANGLWIYTTLTSGKCLGYTNRSLLTRKTRQQLTETGLLISAHLWPEGTSPVLSKNICSPETMLIWKKLLIHLGISWTDHPSLFDFSLSRPSILLGILHRSF